MVKCTAVPQRNGRSELVLCISKSTSSNSQTTNLNDVLGLAGVLLLVLPQEVRQRRQGDDPGPGGVHAGRVVVDGGRGHGVEHLALVAAAAEVGQVGGAVARERA